MSGYQKIIREATGVTKARDLADIEESMRQDVFHSSLDWQSRDQLVQGAKEAWAIVQQLREERNPISASKRFMLGFQEATGLSPEQADAQWAWHSRQLSDSDRQAVEEVGYENGVKEGKAWKEMYGQGQAN